MRKLEVKLALELESELERELELRVELELLRDARRTLGLQAKDPNVVDQLKFE